MILVVSGEERFLRKRTIKQVVDTQQRSGVSVVYTDMSGLPHHFDEGLIPEKRVVVVSDGGSVDPQTIPPDLYCLIEVDGDLPEKSPLAGWVKANPAFHRVFKKPSVWEAAKEAAEFVQEEARNRWTKKVSLPVANALVARAGTDLGVLAFEVAKACILATGSEVTPENVRDSLASLGEADLLPLGDALAEKAQVKVLRLLQRISDQGRSDPTLRVTRFLYGTVCKWYSVAQAMEGLSPKDLADKLRMNPWYLEHKLLPPARKWGKEGLVKLLTALAVGERATLDGHLNPWGEFVSRVLMCF